MAPREATDTEREVNFHGGPSEETKCLPNVEGVIDEGLHPETHLLVPDVKVDGTAIHMPGVANNLRWGSEADAVAEDGREEDALGILVCDWLTPSKEGDTNEFAERP